jgi:hypothetical protein
LCQDEVRSRRIEDGIWKNEDLLDRGCEVVSGRSKLGCDSGTS